MSNERTERPLVGMQDERDVGGQRRTSRRDEKPERVPLDHLVERAEIGVGEVRISVRADPLHCRGGERTGRA